MTEDWKFQRRRARLIETLRSKGIDDERVLAAIGRVPRQEFVDQAFHTRAYRDEALPIGLKQTISQPFTVAYQTMLLDPQPDERILEIGTGSGYQAAVLSELGARVFTVERIRGLYDKTTMLLKRLGYRSVQCRFGDGREGWASQAPFDGIIVTAGSPDVPPALLEQLREPSDDMPGGRLIIPVGGPNEQQMQRITRTGPDAYDREKLEGFRFVPLLGNTSG